MSRACALLALVLAMAISPSLASAQADASSELRAALDARLDPDSTRPVPRLPQVSVDSNGDATVIFAIRSENDDAAATRQGALLDTLTVLSTVYASPMTGVTTTTVLGTFQFKSTKGKSVREGVVLRAVLSADRAGQLAWDQLTPADVPRMVDTWWLQSAFGSVDADASVASADSSSSVVEAAPSTAVVASRLTVAMAHLDEAVAALGAADVGIGRSQFKQFFDVWDELDETIAQLYPVQYESLDVELEHAEFALLHTQPEDVPTALAALTSLRGYLVDIGALL